MQAPISTRVGSKLGGKKIGKMRRKWPTSSPSQEYRDTLVVLLVQRWGRGPTPLLGVAFDVVGVPPYGKPGGVPLGHLERVCVRRRGEGRGGVRT